MIRIGWQGHDADEPREIVRGEQIAAGMVVSIGGSGEMRRYDRNGLELDCQYPKHCEWPRCGCGTRGQEALERQREHEAKPNER